MNTVLNFFLSYKKNNISSIYREYSVHIKNKNKNKKIADLWLDHVQIFTPSLKREYNIPGTYFVADGYDEETKTIYEFQGDFWHGNPNVYGKNEINPLKKCRYGELYDKTIKRRKILESLGYKYIEIWESEFFNIYKFKS